MHYCREILLKRDQGLNTDIQNHDRNTNNVVKDLKTQTQLLKRKTDTLIDLEIER